MTMEQRIAKLERQCRFYRNLFILAGLVGPVGEILGELPEGKLGIVL